MRRRRAPRGFGTEHAPLAGMTFGMDLVRYAFDHLDGADGCRETTVARTCMEFCAGPAFIGFALLGVGTCGRLVVADARGPRPPPPPRRRVPSPGPRR